MILLCLLFFVLSASPGWAAEIFRDTFTGTINTNINAHTPDVGTSWTLIATGGNTAGEISLNGSGAVTGEGPNSAGHGLYTADATYPTADYDVEATFATFTPGGITRTMYIGCRFTATNNFYFAWIEDGAGTNDIRIYSVSSGVSTKLSSTEDTNPTTGDVFTLTCRGNKIGLKKNGVYVITEITDSTHTSAGKALVGDGDIVDITGAASAGPNLQLGLFTVNTVAANRRPVTPMVFP